MDGDQQMNQILITTKFIRRQVKTFTEMKRRLLVFGLAGVAMAAMASAAMAAPPTNVTCPEYNGTEDSTVFQGTAKNLIVPPGHFCAIYGAHITRNVTVESEAFFAAINSTIGHNLISNGAAVIDTGVYKTPGGKGPGPVVVGHDITLSGHSSNLDFCDTTVNHNFNINGVNNAFELQIGDTSERNLDYTERYYSCQGGNSLSPPVTIKHNLTITNSKFGLLDVSNDSIGHKLVVDNNVATYASESALPPGQGMWVANDSIGAMASCVGNSPALASGGPDAAQNTAGKTNNCKF
jgi:hypothetical protein